MKAAEKTSQILELLKWRHEPPQWAIFEELAIKTGYSSQRIDFFAMNVWPSKKFWRVAYEVKVSRADFKNEMQDPNKRKAAEALANECFFVTPAGLVKVDEVPEGWGLIETTKGGLRVKKHAKQRNESGGLPMFFIASLARRLSDPVSEIPKITWTYAGRDLSYEELIKAADHAMERRESLIQEEWRNIGRKQILEGPDFQTDRAIMSIIRKRLGWEYGDPRNLEEWFNEQHDGFITRDMKFRLRNAHESLGTLLDIIGDSDGDS